ncbi:hypothetical protein C8R44DRAFT_880802 [Mycena epipterygia]|nr:hypothetical protein C8R44DRAFT_880802 [Mycena epipterygia]
MTRMKCPRWIVGEATYINCYTPGVPHIKMKLSSYSRRNLYPIRAFLREIEKNDVPTRLKGRKPTCADKDLDDALAEAHWGPDLGDWYRQNEEPLRGGGGEFQMIILTATGGDDTESEGWDGASERWDVLNNDDSEWEVRSAEWEEILTDEYGVDEWEELYEENLKVERTVTAARSYSAVLRGR